MSLESSSRLWITIVIVLCLVSGHVFAHGHHHPKPLKYSYGIYAPTGWTVALYIWVLVKMGFILGALLLLLFAKKWNNNGQSIYVGGGPAFYHRRSLDAAEYNLFRHRSTRDVQLYWNDRISALSDSLQQDG
ncbi:uncharacterized protein LOC128724706 [Anopheles nili]|uniref:uncharacterized protein LOC128724706 n=1 Tax=Anopheles nili TaxID=185578 RepID=UPI00237B7021|nr:uncharacterized protein LOC128724706 [Anopheles nili]